MFSFGSNKINLVQILETNFFIDPLILIFTLRCVKEIQLFSM